MSHFLSTSYFPEHSITLVLQILWGTDAWAVPQLKFFWGTAPIPLSVRPCMHAVCPRFNQDKTSTSWLGNRDQLFWTDSDSPSLFVLDFPMSTSPPLSVNLDLFFHLVLSLLIVSCARVSTTYANSTNHSISCMLSRIGPCTNLQFCTIGLIMVMRSIHIGLSSTNASKLPAS